ncbi:MAG: methylated-DNA--[protein]-cysteine S-methyltransferase [bacterium]
MGKKSVPQKVHYALFRTKLGCMGIASTSQGLAAIVLPRKNKKSAGIELKRILEGRFNKFILKKKKKLLKTPIKDLVKYLKGAEPGFDYELDFGTATAFQTKVYNVARKIPYGKTVSYNWIAEKVGSPRSSRAVGQALKANALPVIVPCHRVIKSNNALCGFSSGVEWKVKLLTIEGVILT